MAMQVTQMIINDVYREMEDHDTLDSVELNKARSRATSSLSGVSDGGARPGILRRRASTHGRGGGGGSARASPDHILVILDPKDSL